MDLAPELLEQRLGQPLAARVLELPAGTVNRADLELEPLGAIGLLILEGLLLVELRAGRAHVGWLIGGDDVIRPWELDRLPVAGELEWRVLAPARVALLGRDFARRSEGVPGLTGALVTRSARTSEWLLAKSLIISSPVIEERLLLLFGLFADRWGVVTTDGVVVKLPLTHALLASLCGSRRPSVTTALGTLEDERLLTRTRGGDWLLPR